MYCRREQVELNREQLSMGWERIDTTKELQVPKNTWSVRHWQLILEVKIFAMKAEMVLKQLKLKLLPLVLKL